MTLNTSLPFNRRPTTLESAYLRLYDVSCSCELDLDQVTLIYELDVDIVKMYLYTKNEVSKVRA